MNETSRKIILLMRDLIVCGAGIVTLSTGLKMWELAPFNSLLLMVAGMFCVVAGFKKWSAALDRITSRREMEIDSVNIEELTREDLMSELRVAINEEDYKKAAAIRDKIKKLHDRV